MKTILNALIFSFMTTSSWATVVTTETFDIYDGKEKQPHYITLTKVDSSLTKVEIFLERKEKTIKLFDIGINKLKVSEVAGDVQIETAVLVKPLKKVNYMNPWGDTSIQSSHHYFLGFSIFEGCKSLIEDEYKKCFIEVSDSDAGEMAMWGSLVKQN